MMDLRSSGGGPATAVILVKKQPTWTVSLYGKIYAILVLFEVSCLTTLCSLSIWYAHTHRNSNPHDSNSANIIYTAITAMITSLSFLYFSLDSILLENIVQYYMAQIMHLMISAYNIWHYVGYGDDLGSLYDSISLYVMIGVCLFQVIYLGLVYPVQKQFGWRLYKSIGGNVTIRPLYRTATIFFSLLKLDFVIGLILILLAIFYLISDALQITLDVLACFCTFAWLMIGIMFVTHESRRLCIVFYSFAVLEPTYLLYKLVRLKSRVDDQQDTNESIFSFKQMLMTGIVALVVRIVCMIYGYLAFRNFGLGLKEKMWFKNDSSSQAQVYSPGQVNTQIHDAEDILRHAPVVVVRAEDGQQDRSALRQYIQPLL